MFPQGGWTIGRIGGIEIKINASLVFITLLVTLSLAGQILPYQAPGASPLLYWIVGIFTSIVFIGSVLWHELAHSMLAQYYGIDVVQIVLHLFGGVAQIARDPERPEQEFWIAIAGPASSVILALFFGFFGLAGGVVGAAAQWLSAVNGMLALFNLLPGFPLDGGRVLRALLWRIGGSYRQATRQASRVGQGMALLFVLFGVIQIILPDHSLFNGLWFILIAAFLYATASLSYRMAKGASLPMNTAVRRVMRYNVPHVEPTTPLAILAWKYLDHARDQAFPVMSNGALVGIVTQMEVNRIPRLEWGKYRVEQVMLPRERLCIVKVDDDLQSAFSALEAAGMDHAPVFDTTGFIGMLNRRDIVYRT